MDYLLSIDQGTHFVLTQNRDAGASLEAFPRWSVGTMRK